jgi:hypothetical protein
MESYIENKRLIFLDSNIVCFMAQVIFEASLCKIKKLDMVKKIEYHKNINE